MPSGLEEVYDLKNSERNIGRLRCNFGFKEIERLIQVALLSVDPGKGRDRFDCIGVRGQGMLGCRWEGNARELENAIERALALAPSDQIEVDDLQLGDAGGPRTERPEAGLVERAVEQRMTLRQLGDLYTERVLAVTGGNKVNAAAILGINRRTLYRRNDRNDREARAANAGSDAGEVS